MQSRDEFIILNNIHSKRKETNMKKILIVIAVLVIGLSFSPVLGQSQMRGGYDHGIGPGMMEGYGPQGGGWYCPNCGSHMGEYRQPQKPIDEKEAASIVGRYLESRRNPNLKTGAVKNVGNAFEVEVRTKDNSLVDKILVDKNSGWIKSAY